MIEYFTKRALKQFLSEKNKPQELKDLQFEFVDSEGVKYYSWERMDLVAVCRVNELTGLGMWADAKISPENHTKICDEINRLNMALVTETNKDKRSKLHAGISTLCSELTTRKNYAIPSQVLIAMASVLLVREDENPNKFNTKIQDEKISQFIKEKNNGNTFFLTFPIFKHLLTQLIGTDVNVMQLLMKWEQDEARQMQTLETISSYTESSDTTKTSAK